MQSWNHEIKCSLLIIWGIYPIFACWENFSRCTSCFWQGRKCNYSFFLSQVNLTIVQMKQYGTQYAITGSCSCFILLGFKFSVKVTAEVTGFEWAR